MRKLTILLILPILLSGCVTPFDPTYYSNPNSPGYAEQIFSGLCDKCNRVYKFSKQQFDTVSVPQCPYCGTVQNLKMAFNRYVYLEQQQKTQADQQYLNDLHQSMQRIREQSYEHKQSYTNINSPGSWSNPIHVKVEDY